VAASKSNLAAQGISVTEKTPDAGGIEQILRKVNIPAAETGRKITMKSGRQVQASDSADEELLVIHNPQGEVELTVRFTEAGPVLNFSAAAVNLQTPGELKIDCGKLKVNSADAIELSSAGDMVQVVNGDANTHIQGKSLFEAHTVNVKSRRGNINVKANDDVCIDGERVKLNS